MAVLLGILFHVPTCGSQQDRFRKPQAIEVHGALLDVGHGSAQAPLA